MYPKVFVGCGPHDLSYSRFRRSPNPSLINLDNTKLLASCWILPNSPDVRSRIQSCCRISGGVGQQPKDPSAYIWFSTPPFLRWSSSKLELFLHLHLTSVQFTFLWYTKCIYIRQLWPQRCFLASLLLIPATMLLMRLLSEQQAWSIPRKILIIALQKWRHAELNNVQLTDARLCWRVSVRSVDLQLVSTPFPSSYKPELTFYI